MDSLLSVTGGLAQFAISHPVISLVLVAMALWVLLVGSSRQRG
jgi:hypothetical protein